MPKKKQPRTIDGVNHWKCGECGQWLPPDAYYRRSRAPNGLRSSCKRCVLGQNQFWADENRETKQRLNRESYQRNVESHRERDRKRFTREVVTGKKWKARARVNKAVSDGRMHKPTTCHCCKAPTPSNLLHAHHEDYDKPLEIVWMCSVCHGFRHRPYSGRLLKKSMSA